MVSTSQRSPSLEKGHLVLWVSCCRNRRRDDFAMNLLGAMRHRDCPACGEPASTASLFLRRSFDEKRLTKASFASRKTPEFMSYQLVKCTRCSTVFASEAPEASVLANAYHEADYGTAQEAEFAARAYRKSLEPFLKSLPLRGAALEIGTGTGVFLGHLRQLGFREQFGIEPSPAAIAAATDDVRSCIRQGIFTGDEFPAGSLSLICCFQTLEHISDPRGFVRAAFQMLEPGGIIALITHDYNAFINRMLGARSPIIDIEHLQLFCTASLRYLISAAGYSIQDIRSIKNVYPLSYWLRLLPVPPSVKRAALGAANAVHLADRAVGLDVGNLLTVARKPIS
jgi:SAM-dependent methyltransferase